MSAMGKVCCHAEKLAKSVLSADRKVLMGASDATSRDGWRQPGTVPKPTSLVIVRSHLPTIHLKTSRFGFGIDQSCSHGTFRVTSTGSFTFSTPEISKSS